MKRLHEKVNVIPLIAKADTMTPEECQQFKKQVTFDLWSDFYMTSILMIVFVYMTYDEGRNSVFIVQYSLNISGPLVFAN